MVKTKGNDTDLRPIIQKFIGWETSLNIWINQLETTENFELLASRIKPSFVSKEYFMTFPVTRKHKDNGLILGELFFKMFKSSNLAVRNDTVYKRMEGTKLTWEKSTTLEKWVTDMFKFDAPPTFLQMLKENYTWIIKQGKTSKLAPKLEIFPTLEVQFFKVEFKDCIYDLKTGRVIPFEKAEPEMAFICYIDRKFDECVIPYNFLGLISSFSSLGYDSFELDQMQQSNLEGEKNESYFLSKASHNHITNKVFDALVLFGGFYHPEMNRKNNPVLYLQGPPSTFKTTIILTIFKQLVGEDNIDIISRHKSKFNLASLKKEGNEPYILLMDDFRWDSVGLFIPDSLNLLDGNFVNIEHKFEKRISTPLKGTIVITSNTPLESNQMESHELSALQTRIEEVKFHKSDLSFLQKQDSFFDNLNKEVVGFAILSNAVFLRRYTVQPTDIDIPKSILCHYLDRSDYSSEPIAYAGATYIKSILQIIYGGYYLEEMFNKEIKAYQKKVRKASLKDKEN